MNTPAHMALSLAVLGRKPGNGTWLAILAGALLPDAVLFALHFLRGGDPRLVAFATSLADMLNSVFLYGALLTLGVILKRHLLILLAASALLHIAFDFPLHASDAHRHFWPLAWRFESPVSFWDQAHHGRVFGMLEGVLFATCLIVIWRRTETLWQKALTALFGLVYVSAFVHFLGHVFAGQHWALW